MDLHKHIPTDKLRAIHEIYSRLAGEEYTNWRFYLAKANAAAESLATRQEKESCYDILHAMARDAYLSRHGG